MNISKKSWSRRDFLGAAGLGGAALSSNLIARLAYAEQSTDSLTRNQNLRLLLNFNENSLGMSPLASEAAQRATRESGNRYSDDMVEQLRATLATMHSVGVQQIIFGNGSTEVIQAVVTAAAEMGAKVIEPSPTFGDVRRYARSENLEILQVPVGSNFETDIRLLRKKANEVKGAPVLINICNPNNPTGTIVDQNSMHQWISESPDNHMFLVDEAYYDYAKSNPVYKSVLPLIRDGKENLVITRTFSKIYGMAGMRIGYGVAAPKTAARVRKFAAGYNLSAPGLAAAIASIDDVDFYRKSRQSNQLAKDILISALDELDLDYINSNTNFILHRINGPLQPYSAHMRDLGIKVGRRMTKDDGWNRLSIGTPQEMDQFVKVLKSFRVRGWV
jgi:histidinol-phosphate aminotransferase